MRARGLGEALAQGLQLGQQRGGLHRLACRCSRSMTIGGEPHARRRPYRPPGIAAQLEALPTQAATIIAAQMDDVAQVQLGGRLCRGQLQAELVVGVVELERGASVTAPFAGADAPQRTGMAMRLLAFARRMPGRCIATGKVAGAADARIAGLRMQRWVVLAAPVVQGAQYNWALHVPLQKAHQHLLAHARQELAAHPRAGKPLRHAQPCAVRWPAGRIHQWKAHADPPERVSVHLIAFGYPGAIVRTDHDGPA
ncbi:hypothetical protein G6F31_014181 [Rhizopus arrhizus]|nr:hypothetical protein G6F31_014181 [Rhizopus arrhizus]